ncbi:MAG: hypothetical protein ABR599_10200 [Gemmatimonadota bacterium]
MTQTTGDLWSRLRRPLLDPRGRFAWADPAFGGLRLWVDGREQPLEALFARIVYNDVERQVLAVGFSETAESRSGCDLLVRLERGEAGVRLEAALIGRLPKRLELGSELLAEHPGAPDPVSESVAAPLAAVGVRRI